MKGLIGPIAPRAQYEKARSYIETAREDGGKVVLGGEEGNPHDLHLEPAIETDLPLGSRVNQMEVFEPVLTVSGSPNEAEALALANGTSFGLGASLWTSDRSRALRTARALDFSDVWVNGYYPRHEETSFAGRVRAASDGSSGCRELEEYISWKRACIDTRTDGFHLKTWFEQGQDFRGDRMSPGGL